MHNALIGGIHIHDDPLDLGPLLQVVTVDEELLDVLV